MPSPSPASTDHGRGRADRDRAVGSRSCRSQRLGVEADHTAQAIARGTCPFQAHPSQERSPSPKGSSHQRAGAHGGRDGDCGARGPQFTSVGVCRRSADWVRPADEAGPVIRRGHRSGPLANGQPGRDATAHSGGCVTSSVEAQSLCDVLGRTVNRQGERHVAVTRRRSERSVNVENLEIPLYRSRSFATRNRRTLPAFVRTATTSRTE